MAILIPAFYFDGKTSRRLTVSLTVEGDIALVTGEASRTCPLGDLRVSERLRNASRKVTFPDGAYLEIRDNTAFNAMLKTTGHQDSFVVEIQQSWHGALVACALTAAVLLLGYVYGLPTAAKTIAHALPAQMDHMIGHETLSVLDSSMLAPSQLPPAQRDAIVKRFKSLSPPRKGTPSYEILFRKSKVGPNAFALPSGQIVLTDELVKLVNDEDAVMGVLSHELGHLHERHLMQRILQSSIIGAGATVLFGDVSSLIATIPTIMLDLKYARDAEREADDYAIEMMKANSISPVMLIHTFKKLEDQSSKQLPYLSSHPPGAERMERIRDAQ
ncbi:MAG TPA: M48 family metallopeptidase [Noviherbaspirillum sp.]|nr:M48 family metallopeptidase [Noviherbaspirillum sp.]